MLWRESPLQHAIGVMVCDWAELPEWHERRKQADD